MKRLMLLCLAVITLWGITSGCKAPADALRVGLESGFAPFEYIEGDKISGIDPDIAQEIAKDYGKALELKDMDFDSLLVALETDKIDMIASGITITAERARQVDFSHVYFRGYQAVVVRSDSEVMKVSELDGKKIGVQLGTTGDKQVTGKRIEPDRYVKYGEAVMALKSGRIDAIVMDTEVAKGFVQQNGDLRSLEEAYGAQEEYAFAVKKGNTELLNRINDTMARLRESGEIKDIINKYIKKD